jgi:hypothetical protein
MRTEGTRSRLLSIRLGAMLIVGGLILGACAHHHRDDADAGVDDGLNPRPPNYKSDILAAMHAYLNDPTGIRDSSISEPMLKAVGDVRHYVVCVRFSAKKNGSSKDYTSVKQLGAVFIAGRFDRFVEPASEQCDSASFTPFPELGTLKR